MDTESNSPSAQSSFPRIALLGLGAMGARMAERLARHTCHLKVWNRSGVPATTPQLKTFAAACTREAVTDADIVISMLRDDKASEEVWLNQKEGALKHLKPDAVLVECSTLSPKWIEHFARTCESHGVTFVHAPVVGSRPQAEAGALIFLAGGSEAALNRVTPVLLGLGTSVHHLGDPVAGSIAKLVVNSLFAIQVAAVAELLSLANRHVEEKAFVELLTKLPVMSPAASAAAQAMVLDKFMPQFPVQLVEKDLTYAQTAACQVGAALPLTSCAHEVFSSAQERGWGSENLTAAVKLYRSAT